MLMYDKARLMEKTAAKQQQSRTAAVRRALGLMSGNIMILSITDLLGNFSRRLVFPYVSLYILALGGNAAQIGYVTALAPLAGLLMFPLGGYIADRASRVKLIVLANVITSLLVLMRGVAPSWELIAVASLLQGLAAIQFPARSALIADSLRPGDRGKGIAMMNTVANTLAIFAPFLAGIIVEHYGPNFGVRILYTIMLIAYVFMTLINARYLKEPPTKTNAAGFRLSELANTLKESYSGIPAMLKQFPPSLRALAGVIILTFVANGIASPFWVVYAVEQIHIASSAWGFILLLETVVKLLMFIPAGILVDRWGRTTSLTVALFLSLVAIPAFALATTFVAALLIRVILAVAFALTIPACSALMADLVPRQIRGRVMSAIGQGSIMIGPAGGGTGGPAMGFLITIPLMLASLAGGYLYTLNPASPWFVVMGTTAISVVLTLFFVRDPHTAEI
jgi:MFS family permease